MSLQPIAIAVLLWLGVALVLLSCLGTAAMRDTLDRLHFAAPGTLGILSIALAVLVRYSFSLLADKALLVAAAVVLLSPVMTSAIGRATRVVADGDWSDRGRGGQRER